MTKSELIKALEHFPDDCEIKIKYNGKLYSPIESGWKYDVIDDHNNKNILFENVWSNKISEYLIKTKKKATEYTLTINKIIKNNDNDNDVYKFDITKIHGYIKSGVFKVELNKSNIEQFNSLNSKEDKVHFLESIGEIKITDFDIEDFDLDIDKDLKL